MHTLIISEKDTTAKKIAAILAKGKVKSEKKYNIPVYSFSMDGKDVKAIGLKGHILKVNFPAQYDNWQKVEPMTLIDADIVKSPIQLNLVKAVKSVVKDATDVIIATDFDREGELIGTDALNVAKEVNKDLPAKRARFSSLTKEEITKSFSNLDDLYTDLASAGGARQDIDLIWGATLTRFVSLATTRLGHQFLSVGRVQSPTLALIAEREMERKAFKPVPYWQLFATFSKDEEQFVAQHKTERFLDEAEANKSFSNLKTEGKVVSTSKTTKKSAPPAPFNTTAFLSAAASIGISPARAMRLAESLYMDGLISYPRVDNTVYPATLDFRGILETLADVDQFSKLSQELLAKKELKPTRGKKEATDHPPIHPTGAADPGSMDPAIYKIYELVSRRFMATLADESESQSTRVDIDCGGEPFFIRGRTILKEGWLKYYIYSRKKDEEIPILNDGDILNLLDKNLDAKETTPPPRYSQAKLITIMEELGLGTKSTRHSIIQSLFDRGYIHSDPIVPTELGLSMASALKKHAPKVVSPELTAELESDMDKIADGKTSSNNVVDTSRKMLGSVMVALESNKEALSAEIREGIREDRMIGECPNCKKALRIIRSKRTKKRFVGCSGYPDCKTTFPLPQRGEIVYLHENCPECNAPKVKVLNKGARPWIICIDPNCPTKTKKPEEDKKEDE